MLDILIGGGCESIFRGDRVALEVVGGMLGAVSASRIARQCSEEPYINGLIAEGQPAKHVELAAYIANEDDFWWNWRRDISVVQSHGGFCQGLA